jgi:hypothetical protein
MKLPMYLEEIRWRAEELQRKLRPKKQMDIFRRSGNSYRFRSMLCADGRRYRTNWLRTHY